MKKRLLLMLMVTMSVLQAMALSTTDYASNNYIDTWGRLKLNGVQLSDDKGNAVQLRGWATHGYQWQSVKVYFDAKNDFQGMKNLGANVVRLTCYVSATADDVTQDAWNQTKTWVKNAITWCAELGLYAIVDYHVLTPGNPNDYFSTNNARQSPTDFFTEISAYVKQNGYKHVLYEICNEPNVGDWNTIKTYANQVLPVIAANDPNAVVIVGTPQWSQLLNDANNSKITHSTLQIMYTFHFYACAHSQLLNTQFTDNILRQIPVFVTEWNDTYESGRQSCGTPPTSAVSTFLNRCNGNNQKVSWTAWSWSPVEIENNQDRTSSSWKNGTPSNGNSYTTNNLSPTGKMIYDELQKNHINYTSCSNYYTVTFNSDGGTAISPRQVCAGSKTSEPTKPKKTGYTFLGWYNGNVLYDFNNTIVNGNLTLTAKWEVASGPTMIADCNKGNATKLGTYWYTYNDNGDGGASVTNPSTAGDLPFKMTYPGANNTDSAAVITYTLNKGTLSYNPFVGLGFNMKDEEAAYDLTGSTGISFYHKGDAIRFSVKQTNITDGGYHGFAVSAHTNWTKVTITWDELAQETWAKPVDFDETKITGFQWQRQAASGSGTVGIDEVQLEGISLELDDEGEEPDPTCPVSFTVSFNTNGGVPAIINAQTICEGEAATAPTDPAKTGFRFTGWNNGSTAFNFSTPIITNITLVAQWEEVSGPLSTIIADCETDSTLLNTYWFGYGDGVSTYTTPTSEDPNAAEFPMLYGPGAYRGNGVMKVSYSLAAANPPSYSHWGIGTAFNFNKDESLYNLTDAATGISFWHKGDAITFQVKTADCLGDDTYNYTVPASANWTEFNVTWEELTFPSWATSKDPVNPDPKKIIALQWQASTSAQARTGSFMLDDIRVDGVELKLPEQGGGVNVPETDAVSFSIYPNPAQNGNFNIILEGTASVSVVSLQGQTVYSTVVDGSSAINANLEAGVYMVLVQSENGVKAQKLIVK